MSWCTCVSASARQSRAQCCARELRCKILSQSRRARGRTIRVVCVSRANVCMERHVALVLAAAAIALLPTAIWMGKRLRCDPEDDPIRKLLLSLGQGLVSSDHRRITPAHTGLKRVPRPEVGITTPPFRPTPKVSSESFPPGCHAGTASRQAATTVARDEREE